MNSAQRKSAPGMERFYELISENHCACVSGEQHTRSAGGTASIQPFGSMPRDCSSLRNIRLIHVANDESPSLRISSSSCERSSCANLIWYWSVLDFSLDIVITKLLLSACCNYNVTYVVLQLIKTAKPGSVGALTGPLTNNVMETNAMATPQCNQTQLKKVVLPHVRRLPAVVEACLDPFSLVLYRERHDMLHSFKLALEAAGVEYEEADHA